MDNNQRLIANAQNDAQAFAMAADGDQLTLIRHLLRDTHTEAFSPTVVRWLVNELDNLAALRQEERIRANSLIDQLADAQRRLQYASATMPKSKAIVKQARMIARLADCITDVNQAINHACDHSNTDSDASEDLNRALSAWQEQHKDTIEAAFDAN